RRFLDLVFRAVDEHRLGVEIDIADDTRRKHDLLAEDPRTGVDDDEAVADVVGRIVDLADAAVQGLYREPRQVPLRHGRTAVRPEISRHVQNPLETEKVSLTC